MEFPALSKSARTRLAASALAASGLVLALGACGGSPTVTRASYDKKANAICKTYERKVKSIGGSLSHNASKSEVEHLLSHGVAVAKQGVGKLDALPKPSNPPSALAHAFHSQKVELGDLDQVLADLKKNDLSQVQRLSAKIDRDGSQVNRYFDAAGLRACGSGTS